MDFHIMRSRRAPRVHARFLGPILFALLSTAALPPASFAQNVDYAILGCTIVDGPTSDTIDLVLQIGVLTPETGAWDVPTDIWFNGLSVEPTHHLTIEKNFLQACQQTFSDCALPFPCGFTKWSYKGRGPFFENWRCLANFRTNQCDCVDPGAPVAYKTVQRPSTSGFFDVFVDLSNGVLESDEQNNRCRVFYAGPTPALPHSWGAIKDLYYR